MSSKARIDRGHWVNAWRTWSPQIRLRPVKDFAFFALLAGIVQGLHVLFDMAMLRHVFADPADSLIGPLAYLLSGYTTGAPLAWLLSALFGTRLDRDYKGFSVPPPPVLRGAAWAGFLSVSSTFFYFWAATQIDWGQVLPLSSLSLVFLKLWDARQKHVAFRASLVPLSVVIVGVGLSSMEQLGLKGITLAGIGAMVLDQLLVSGEEAVSQRSVRSSPAKVITDNVSFAAWRSTFAAGWAMVAALAVVLLSGRGDALIAVFLRALPLAVFLVPVRLFSNFLVLVWLSRARSSGPLSSVAAITAVKLVIWMPLGWLLAVLGPSFLGLPTSNPWVWGLRTLGAMLLVAGVVMFYSGHDAHRDDRQEDQVTP